MPRRFVIRNPSELSPIWTLEIVVTDWTIEVPALLTRLVWSVVAEPDWTCSLSLLEATLLALCTPAARVQPSSEYAVIPDCRDASVAVIFVPKPVAEKAYLVIFGLVAAVAGAAAPATVNALAATLTPR